MLKLAGWVLSGGEAKAHRRGISASTAGRDPQTAEDGRRRTIEMEGGPALTWLDELLSPNQAIKQHQEERAPFDAPATTCNSLIPFRG